MLITWGLKNGFLLGSLIACALATMLSRRICFLGAPLLMLYTCFIYAYPTRLSDSHLASLTLSCINTPLSHVHYNSSSPSLDNHHSNTFIHQYYLAIGLSHCSCIPSVLPTVSAPWVRWIMYIYAPNAVGMSLLFRY